MDIISFTKEDNHIKDALKKDGVKICRDRMDSLIIRDCIEKFTNGFCFTMPKAMVGQRSRNWSDRNIIKSFILFDVSSFGIINIKLLCSSSRNTQARELLDSLYEYGYDNDCSAITLEALAEERLVQWYQDNGFIRGDTIFDRRSGEPKVVLMSKQL